MNNTNSNNHNHSPELLSDLLELGAHKVGRLGLGVLQDLDHLCGVCLHGTVRGLLLAMQS
jgi:hypothetical protein